jgi:hypothetical protein
VGSERPKRVDDLKIDQVDDGFIIYQPSRDRVHYLNHTGILVLELCDGSRTVPEIAEAIQQIYELPAPPEQEVREILGRAGDEGLTT